MSGVARWALEVFITNESGTKTLQPRPSTINFTMTVNRGREDQVACTKNDRTITIRAGVTRTLAVERCSDDDRITGSGIRRSLGRW